MSSKHFKVGDMVWAKMKGFPPWPGEIVEDLTSSSTKSPKSKKHCVYFFGTNDHAWILDENITPHRKSILESSKNYKSHKYEHAITEFLKHLEFLKKRSPRMKKKFENSDDIPEVKAGKLSTNSGKKRQQKMESPHARKRSLRDSSKRQSTDSVAKSCKRYKNTSALTRCSRELSSTQLSLKGVDDFQKYDFKFKYEKFLVDMYDEMKKEFPSPSKKRVGFIGLGFMGGAIAKLVVESGHDVTVWAKTTSECTSLVRIGAKQAQSLVELIASCDVIFCCMSTPDAAKEVIFGDDGVLKSLEQAKEPKSYVEMTSIDPETSKSIKEAINLKGGLYLEASLCGSVADAEANQLLIVASGDKEVFDECEGIFYTFAKRSSYLTPEVGASSEFALRVNTCMATIDEVIKETLVFVEKLNVDKDLFMDYLFSGALCISDIVRRRQEMQHHDADSTVASMRENLQDMNRLLDLAKANSIPLPITEVVAARINDKLAG